MDNMLSQVVKKPTRGKNILDLALVKNISTVIDVENPFGSCGHKMVHFTVNCQIPK